MCFKHLAIFFTDMNKMGTFLHVLNRVPSLLCIKWVESLFIVPLSYHQLY